MEYRTHYITPEDYERAEKNGISRKTLESRVRRQGYHIERAVTQPLMRLGDHREWYSLLEEYGTPPERFRRRISEGWDEWEAATTPYIKPRGRKPKGNVSLAKGLLMITDMSYTEVQKATGCSRTWIANHARKIRSWTSHYEEETVL